MTTQKQVSKKSEKAFPHGIAAEMPAPDKAREPLTLEAAQAAVNTAREEGRTNEAVDVVVGDMSKGLLGDAINAEALLAVVATANRAFSASGELSEVGSVAVARAAFIVVESAWTIEEGKRVNPCLDLLREYDGDNKTSLEWRNDVMVTVGLIEQKPFGDEVRYVRREGVAKSAYSGWNMALTRLAPIFLFGYGPWQEMEREAHVEAGGKAREHYSPIVIATVARADGSKTPRMKVPACLIEEDAVGLVALDGQEKRTIQTARASARQQLGFSKEEGSRDRDEKLNKREATRAQQQAFDAVKKIINGIAFGGVGEGQVRAFEHWPPNLKAFLLPIVEIMIDAGAPVLSIDEERKPKFKKAA